MHHLSIKIASASGALLLVGFISAQGVSTGQVIHGPVLQVRPKAAVSGTWQRSVNSPPASVGMPMLLTDGSVMCHGPSTNKWYKLTPNSAGSYVNGTWTTLAAMQSDYAPLYFASSVLADGRVVAIGGEYNFGQSAWTNKGAYYNPVTDKWTVLPAPNGWSNVGDSQCHVLPDGRFMLANFSDTRMAFLTPSTMQWSTLQGTGKLDRFDEEGWVLLPDGTILTCDAINAPHAERYIPANDKWISAGDTPQSLCDAPTQELGPMLLMPDGKVFAFGATGHNAIYTPGSSINAPGSWVAAPDFPNIGGQLDIADGPACMMPNGKLLAYASPGFANAPSHFYEWDGTAMLEVNNVPNSGTNPSFVGNFLLLPNGQVMFTDLSRDVEFYNPSGGPQNSWRPSITSVPASLMVGKTFIAKGTQFNGLTAGSAYGDDSTNNTNYPLARIIYKNSHHVVYFRTHDHSSMAVATGSKLVQTNVDVPSNAEVGPATIEIIANGIASLPVNVTVTKEPILPTGVGMYEGTSSTGNIASIVNSDDSYFIVNSANLGASGQVASAFVTFTLPGGSANSLQYTVESNTSSSVQALFFAWNYSLGRYDSISNAAQTTNDVMSTFTIPNASQYVGPGGVTKILIRAVNPTRAGKVGPAISLRVDQVTVAPG